MNELKKYGAIVDKINVIDMRVAELELAIIDHLEKDMSKCIEIMCFESGNTFYISNLIDVIRWKADPSKEIEVVYIGDSERKVLLVKGLEDNK